MREWPTCWRATHFHSNNSIKVVCIAIFDTVKMASATASEASSSSTPAFAGLSSIVDGRILRSLASQGFTQPTPIQSTVLPLAITDNKDILARAKTGSGKTLAYAIPLAQKILSARAKLEDGYSSPDYLATRALVLVPTRELAEQISSHIRTLCEFFKDRDAIRVVNVAGSSQSSKGKTSQDKVQKWVILPLH